MPEKFSRDGKQDGLPAFKRQLNRPDVTGKKEGGYRNKRERKNCRCAETSTRVRAESAELWAMVMCLPPNGSTPPPGQRKAGTRSRSEGGPKTKNYGRRHQKWRKRDAATGLALENLKKHKGKSGIPDYIYLFDPTQTCPQGKGKKKERALKRGTEKEFRGGLRKATAARTGSQIPKWGGLTNVLDRPAQDHFKKNWHGRVNHRLVSRGPLPRM